MRLHSRGRFNVKRLARLASDRLRGTPFDRALAEAARNGVTEFVFGWNRGLGDIALGLVPLFARIRAVLPAARIVVFTRGDLAQGFALTDCTAVHVVPGLDRGRAVDIASAAAACGTRVAADAVVFADPDPTRWLDGQRQTHPPVLHWHPQWDARASALPPAAGDILIGAHVSSETARYYGYVKDWPANAWRALFARYPQGSGVRWVLFGQGADEPFAQDNVTDLRGRTDLIALLATLRTRCRILVAPDSGVLTLAYYLDGTAPLDVISLWSDPRQGILKQACPSPNPRLVHVALRGRDEDVRNIAVDDVAGAVAAALARAGAASATHASAR
ncbi:MAG: glycosyltransferase family 9 protein [Burkholderiaceae bacterium]